MEIKGSDLTELKYIRKLLYQFEQGGLASKVKRTLKGQSAYSKSELAKFLHHEKSDSAYQFLKKLEDEGVLIHAGKRENASGTVPVWTVDKSKLRQAFQESDFYQDNRKLFAHVLEKEGKALKIP